MPPRPDDLPVQAFATPAALDRWLAQHGATAPGVWVQLAKQASGIASITVAEMVDAALCHGWIDGQARPVDAHWWKVRLTPRRAKSIWSAKNRARVAELEAAGRMRPAGQAAVAAAQADGRWDAAYASPRNATVPDDLRTALAHYPFAEALFDVLDRPNRYAVLHRIHTPRTPAGRAAAIERLVTRLAVGEAPYPTKPSTPAKP